MTQLNAFIARSFAQQDEERIRPLLDFLGTFQKAGFFCQTAEAAEVESVSEKVRRMIDDNQVFIGFLTKRHPVYNFKSRLSAAFRLLMGNVNADVWAPPGWVLQESGYALRAGRKLILLREEGVEVPGLQGDLEYIPFEASNSVAVFSKLSEMINGLLAEASGTEVKLSIIERKEEAQAASEPTTAKAEIAPEQGEEGVLTITDVFVQMFRGTDDQNLEEIAQAWQAGTSLIAEGKGGRFDKLAWDCRYFEARFRAGDAGGLESLKRLRDENPGRAEPTAAVARCFYNAKEFDASAPLYLEAASLQQGSVKAGSLIAAARAFKETKQFDEARKAIESALLVATDEQMAEAVLLNYQLVKESGSEFLAFGIAESALHENPGLWVRFSLALDYRLKDLDQLALYHFNFLHSRNANDSSSLHNLALVRSDCKLPISSVEGYKQAFALGQTLSAANLGYMYLDCGMEAEAKALVEAAMKADTHDSRVEKCLAEIIQRREKETEKESELLKSAGSFRAFFVSMGRGLRSSSPHIGGQWKFPFGVMRLEVNSEVARGTANIKKEENAFGTVFLHIGEPAPPKFDTYTFKGKLTGTVCEFELTIEDNSESASITGLPSLAGPTTKSGFVVFAEDGKAATYAEISDRKLGKLESITKAD